jgi:hypothetical protein
MKGVVKNTRFIALILAGIREADRRGPEEDQERLRRRPDGTRGHSLHFGD